MLQAQEAAAEQKETEEGFKVIFDGKSMEGWKINESPDSWHIEDGAIVAHGQRSHLFYVGEGQPYKNFHLKIDVKTTPAAIRESTSIPNGKTMGGPSSVTNAKST